MSVVQTRILLLRHLLCCQPMCLCERFVFFLAIWSCWGQRWPPDASQLQIVAAFFDDGDSQQLLHVRAFLSSLTWSTSNSCWQWFDSKGLDMDGAENSVLPRMALHCSPHIVQLPLPKLGQGGVLKWLQVHCSPRRVSPVSRASVSQSFIGELEFSMGNIVMIALFGLWFFIRAM